jgi:hypothetical protein
VIETRVNNVPVDNSYTLKDAKGTVIRSRNFSSFAANTFIRDTFNLSYGCYSFDFKDDQGNGLSFWAAPNDGSGSVRFVKIPIAILKTFNSDFGSFLNYNFRVSSQVGIKEQDFLLRTNVYPNPANTVLHIETTSPLSSATLTTLEGRMVRLYSKSDLDNSELNLLELPVGVYLLKLASAHGETKVHKVVIAR